MKTVRRGIAGIAAAALTAAGLSVLGVATAPSAHAEEVSISNASLTWGLSGYAQKGIFGPWTYKDLTGNVSQLTGSVSSGTQNEYLVDPVPATSMPTTSPAGKTANAVKFTQGAGTSDSATGAVSLSWTGSYTVNAYPAQYNAPNEIYSNPKLTLDGDGDGTLTMNFALGAGQDMSGNPTPAVDLGRLTVLTFSDGSVDETGFGKFRATPNYQGVEVTVPSGETAQNRTCTASGGATGWWGSWPSEFVNAVPASIRPHFYSTGCGGLQDNKPALPVDVDLGISPKVSVSADVITLGAARQITVTGSGFDPARAIGTRPPLAGQPAGVYIAFGKFAENWRPSASAPSSSRATVQNDVQWATPNGVAPGTATLNADGTFSVTLKVDKAALDALATSPSLTQYGIYTYAGSGASEATFETYTPISFVKATGSVSTTVTKKPTPAATGTATLKVTSDETATGDVQLQVKRANGSVVATTSAQLQDGAAAVTLPRLAPGRYSLVASYAGDGVVAGATSTTALDVAKVAARVTASWAKKPTARKAGKLKVTVSATGVTATGKVTVVIKNAKGKKVRTVAGTLSKGVVTIKVPKLKAGKYKLSVAYAGDSQLNGASSSAKVTAKRR